MVTCHVVLIASGSVIETSRQLLFGNAGTESCAVAVDMLPVPVLDRLSMVKVTTFR